jgi:putative nucleotidyltransferase with HDIG domain
VYPVLDHTISVLRWLVVLEDALFAGKDAGAEQVVADVQERFGCYADDLASHFSRPIDGGLTGKTLLRLGALFHDVGKAQTQTVQPDGRIRFLRHEIVGAGLAGTRLRKLKLSREAVSHVKRTVEGHMRPLWLTHAEHVTRRAVYRFFRTTGTAGLDIGLLSIADHLGTFGEPDLDDSWELLLDLVDRLFSHYFEAYDEIIAPPPLLNGSELIAALELEPGPIVGRLLRLIEEAQAAGDISTREEALELARSAQ